MPPGPQLEATPLVVDGTMYTTYTTASSAGVYAIDAKSGLLIWKYDRHQETVNPNQINPFNRGVAVLGNRVFFGTLDAVLVALDARTGRILWETKVADDDGQLPYGERHSRSTTRSLSELLGESSASVASSRHMILSRASSCGGSIRFRARQNLVTTPGVMIVGCTAVELHG